MNDKQGVAGWTHTTAEIPPRGLEVLRQADGDELKLLAAELHILGLERLEVAYAVKPLSGGRYRLSGKITGRAVQACIVTLDPVSTDISDSLTAEFRPEGDFPLETSAAEAEIGALEAEEYEPIEQHRLAIGRVIVETLASALPAYPRAPGAELEQHEAGPAGGGEANPFAVLADWKPKPK